MKKLAYALLFATAGLFAQDKVKFTAKIENRNSDTIRIVGQNFNKIIVGKNGSFTDTFDAPKGFYQLGDGTEVTSLFLAPGFDVNLKMDAKMFDESIAYTGKGSKENNILAWLGLQREGLDNAMEKGDEAALNSLVDNMIKGANEKVADKEVDELFRQQISGGMQQLKGQLAQMAASKSAISKLNGADSPTFDYENHKGGKTKLSDFKGKYVYIDNWATWCGPCRGEIPHLQKIEEAYHGKNIEFVSISIDAQKDHDKWKKFVDDKKLGGVQLMADNDWNSEFIKAYGITGIPRFILIGPDGKVINADAPRPSDPALKAVLDKLVK
ncbi:TlpA family protein disulfide reductase [Flavobacterium silvaticum]|uniref:TlpA family protein disulfide reductase n=1 Tax=Flavobacterium silvaticum TaxID=1852020 RepID=A0A972JG54_9FLAO|nr:TlpA disulfide reductase family protein [Flavobacterium silvaticum]NMH28694.1 TlpA family protein disulfide reductase [Flavobacterium silvaticum]